MEGRVARIVSSSFSASAFLLSMSAWKSLSELKVGVGSGLGVGFSASAFDFVFFADIFDTFLSYLEYAFPFG